jgi:predicted Zn-dependent peptidase
MLRRTPVFRLLFLLALFCPLLAAQSLASFEKRITVKTLPNGLTVLICERHEAPVFSFYTIVDAGDVQDPSQESGLAHMFEHMAFKGTDKIGTTNYAAEKVALDKVEQAYAEYDQARRMEVGRNEKKVEELKQAFDAAVKEAQQYVIPNQFGELIERNGGEGLNASTSMDETTYYYSMPVNRLELWAYLESERFLHPVLREFYTERDVVYEERRMRVDSDPQGRALEQFLATAFVAHPYQRSGVGWPSEISSVTATEAKEFFHKYYVPANIVIALVGDVTEAQAMPLIEKYFGRLPAGPKPEALLTVEPPQFDERRVLVPDPAQPFYIEGYHRPSYRDPDDATYDALADVLSNGRTSRLYKSLVRDKRIALAAGGFSGYPGNKYPNLFAFYAYPTQGHTAAEMEVAFQEQIELVKTQPVTDDELASVKTRVKADLIRGLGDNSGLAAQLAWYQLRYGDWRELFHYVDKIEKVSKQDIQRVANQTFRPTNRTVTMIVSEPPKPKLPRPEHGSQPKTPAPGLGTPKGGQ